MALHVLKYAVGINNINNLRDRQSECLRKFGRIFNVTRLAPRRREEILDGGSIYWIIKRHIRVRQQIVDIVKVNSERPGVEIILSEKLYATTLSPRRPHQGWRYLEDSQAPPDLSGGSMDIHNNLPEKLAEDLHKLELI